MIQIEQEYVLIPSVTVNACTCAERVGQLVRIGQWHVDKLNFNH